MNDYEFIPGCQCERCWQRTEAGPAVSRRRPMMADVLAIMRDEHIGQDEAVHHAYRCGLVS